MKTNKLIIGLLAVAATSLVSCEKFGADVETPSVSISVSPQNPKVGEEVTVTINTDAQYLTLLQVMKARSSNVRALKPLWSTIGTASMKSVTGFLMPKMGKRPCFINTLKTISPSKR